MDLDPQHFPWDSLSWEEESFIISREKRHEERVLQKQLMAECCKSNGWMQQRFLRGCGKLCQWLYLFKKTNLPNGSQHASGAQVAGCLTSRLSLGHMVLD